MRIRELQVAALAAAAAIWHVTGPLRAGPISVPSSKASIASTAGSAATDQPSQLGKAITAFQQHDLPATLQWLEEARKEHPDLAPAEIMLANMFFSEGQPDKGREVLEQAAVKHPADPEPHLIFGDLAWRQKRLSDAQVQYERGAQLTKKFTGSSNRKHQLKIRALVGLANVAEARQQFSAAQKLYSALVKLEPKHAQARFRLGNVLFALGQPNEALAEFRAAADLLETAPSPELTLAELYRQAGNADEAERWINQAIQESPEDVRPQLVMAHWQLDVRNDPQAAVPFVDRAAQLDSTSPEVPLLRGIIAWCQGDNSQAEQIFESLVLKQPNNVQANNYLAAVLAEQDDASRRRRAWELVQITAEANPRAAETAATFGWVAYHLGRLTQAEQQLRAATTAASVSRDTKYYLARTMFRRGQIAEAQKALQQALEANGLFIHLREARDWQKELGKPEY
jgi:tetratricopeptide (TPR) repeat protein